MKLGKPSMLHQLSRTYGWHGSSTAGPAAITQVTDGTTIVDPTEIIVPAGGLTDNGDGTVTLQYEQRINGGLSEIHAYGSPGATVTLDPAAGNVLTLTLTANCTVTLTAPVDATAACGIEIRVTEGGSGGYTITWPGSVTWIGGTPSPTTTVGAVSVYFLETLDGGTTWLGLLAGGGIGSASFATPAIVLGTTAAAGSAATTIRSDSTIVAFDSTTPAAIGTAATGSQAVAARRDHVHATGAGTPTTSAIGDAAATGSGPAAAMTNHVHGREALSVATPLVESGSGAVGTAVVSSREDHVHPAAPTSSGTGIAFTIIGQETRTSDGSTTTYLLDNDYDDDSVQAFNLTSGKALVVTENGTNSVTIGAAGTAGDSLSFAYAALAA